ncbi:PHP domain-containing protein [Neptunicella sp. SCSIO 80796]|uniref:PHP domain-containing protein n=1 Tax=Neptunicella plasticusilytica TaxID=3117012 RepID=UPI003A4DB442
MKTRISRPLKYLLILAALCLLTGWLLLSTSPVVQNTGKLTSKEALTAHKTAKELVKQFASNATFIEIELSQAQLDAVMISASHSIPAMSFDARISPFGVLLLANAEFSVGGWHLFSNFNCLLSPGIDRFEINTCYIGRIPLSGSLARWLIKFIVSSVFGEDVETTVIKLLDDAKLTDNKLLLTTTKSDSFKQDINDSLRSAAEIARTINQFDDIDEQQVQIYIDYLNQLKAPDNSFSFYVREMFAFAQQRSRSGNPVEENTSLLWALCIRIGNPAFARLIGLQPDYSQPKLALVMRGRTDLVLHFLYSVLLEQLGRSDFGLGIGELKEVLDTNEGGSGFSFADLTADKSGLAFSEFVIRNKKTARSAQKILAEIKDESMFMPFVHDLPEGFTDKEFAQVFDSIESPLYKSLEHKISQRIAALPLYHDAMLPVAVAPQPGITTNPVENGKWLMIDTHMHSTFSDGNQSIKQLADKAHEFGCDVIAVTDHGDYNLDKVVTDEYFDQIAEQDKRYSDLTVIAGLEWNIAPMMGREHMTVLFPQYANMQRDLAIFRSRYDSWGRKSENLLNADKAFEWLDKHASYDGIKPVVFYNHPSRKDAQTTENQYDIEQWLSDGHDALIGFSGAPGHQKKRGADNGSYDFVSKTLHGWDPSIAVIGGEWDRLLQEGYFIWAARAASDFHNTRMDYWPCQFSSTHLYAKSSQQNDVLSALRKGNFWAQQGKFVSKLDFHVNPPQDVPALQPGDIGNAPVGQQLTVTLEVDLNQHDWQGFDTSLDEVELVILTHSTIKTERFSAEQFKQGKTYRFSYPLKMGAEDITLRWRGRSIQPELHHYMFYTNPIRLLTH